MPKTLTYVTAILSFIAAVIGVFAKLGGGASFVSVSMFMAVPYFLCVGLAEAFRRHRKEGWIVFVGTAACAFFGLHGVYSAFFSGSPEDPWKALTLPLYQMGIITFFAAISGVSALVGKGRKRRTREEPPE